jgi:ribonuclease HI
VHCDGSALPNPGLLGIGVVLVSPDGFKHCLSRATGERGCNNEAEASALLVALQEAHRLGARRLQIFTDSVVVVEQTTGRDRTKIERLAVRFAEIRARFTDFEAVSLAWVARRKNLEADALSRAALGLAPKSSLRK